MDEKIIAVDLGGSRVRTAVSDRSLRLSGRTDEPTLIEAGPAAVIDQIARQTRQSVREAGTTWDQVQRLVIGAPGPLDSISGVILSAPNLPGWDNVPLSAELASKLQIPVKVVNDANVAALGEFHAGAGRGCRHLVYITVSTGIGGGIVSDGRLLEGSSGIAGELGHMTIERHGPLCKCGNRGCLEAVASGTAIARRFQERLDAGEASMVSDRPGGAAVSAADVAHGAARGDPLALEVFTDAAEAIGFGVVSCIHIFNPEVIAIGGGVSRAGDLLFDPIKRIVERHAMAAPRRVVRIVLAELGDDVGLVGAAALGYEL